MPIQETIEAVRELEGKNLTIGSVIVNRVSPHHLPPESIGDIAAGVIDAAELRAQLDESGLKFTEADFEGLLTEHIEHASRVQAQLEAGAELEALEPDKDRKRVGEGQSESE